MTAHHDGCLVESLSGFFTKVHTTLHTHTQRSSVDPLTMSHSTHSSHNSRRTQHPRMMRSGRPVVVRRKGNHRVVSPKAKGVGDADVDLVLNLLLRTRVDASNLVDGVFLRQTLFWECLWTTSACSACKLKRQSSSCIMHVRISIKHNSHTLLDKIAKTIHHSI